MSLFNKHHTPADQGFEAARHEPLRKKKRKVIPPVVTPVVPPKEEYEMPEYSPYKKQMADLFAKITEMQATLQDQSAILNTLVKTDEKVHKEIEEPKDEGKVRQERIYAWLDDFENSTLSFDEIKKAVEEDYKNGELTKKESEIILKQLR
jgi:hypothetical protein